MYTHQAADYSSFHWIHSTFVHDKTTLAVAVDVDSHHIAAAAAAGADASAADVPSHYKSLAC